MTISRLAFPILALGAAVLSALPVDSAGLTSHRAMYTMSLGTGGASGAPSGVRGVMSYEFRDQCDAWSVSSKVYMRLKFGKAHEIESIRKMATWEAKDGLGFRFRFEETDGRKNVQEIKGVALLDSKSEGGVVEYIKPSRFKVKLPKGTLFPTAHIDALINSSNNGEKHLGKVIFDGSSLDDPYLVSAVMGGSAAGAKLGAEVSKILQKASRWNARLAYFPVKSDEDTPEFELGVRFRDDGIVENIIQDYGKYTIVANLGRVELLPAPNCSP